MPFDRRPKGEKRQLRATSQIWATGINTDGVTIIAGAGGQIRVGFAAAGGLKGTGGAGIKLDATTPGLALSSAGLKMLLDTNPGLVLGAGGVKILLPASSGLALGASGLTVQGLATLAADPGSPTNGDAWYNSTSASSKFRVAGITRELGGLLYANTADSTAIASTAAETNFNLNLALPAAYFRAGRALLVRICGVYSDILTPTLQLKLKAGSVTLLDLGAVLLGAGVSSKVFSAVFLVICRTTGGSGTLQTTVQSAALDGVQQPVAPTVATVDTTATQTLQVSAQWSASSSSNTTALQSMTIEALN